nr:RHS repeat-associated core domain-containing protein [uncultured Bacteroides sp.]
MSFAEGVTVSGQPYKYNGKELDTERGLNLYDYSARLMDPALGRFSTVDPLAEKYYSWSPYHYGANNPIITTDPTGMDWYQDAHGNGFWQEGSANTVTRDNIIYSNIGATYTQNIGSGTSITYTQNELTSMTTNTLTSDQWVSQYSKSDWDGTPASKACNKASDTMLANADVSSKGMEVVVNNAGNGRAGSANNKAADAINSMSTALDLGKPTKVNIDRKANSSSADKMGDHFIVVEGKTETLKNSQVISTTFNYFDPGTHHISKGTSSSNTLNIINRTLVGTLNKQQIIVTSIRPSK